MKPDYIIFPDASQRRIRDKVYSGYGTVILNVSTRKYTTISGYLASNSVVFAEAWAIYQGLRFLEYKKNSSQSEPFGNHVLVLSDSKLNIDTFNIYIPYAWDLSDPLNWKKRDHNLVKNQELYRCILHMTTECDYKVKFAHVNSHIRDNPKQLVKVQEKLKKKYAVQVSYDVMELISDMNDLADQAAKQETLAVMMQDRNFPDQFIQLERMSSDA